LHRCNERNPVGRVAAHLAALNVNAEVGIVDLDAAGEATPLLAVEHQIILVQRQPDGGAGHTHVAL